MLTNAEVHDTGTSLICERISFKATWPKKYTVLISERSSFLFISQKGPVVQKPISTNLRFLFSTIKKQNMFFAQKI